MKEELKMPSKTSFQTPRLERAWTTIPEGIRKTLSSEPIIPAIAAKAKKIAAEKPNFIRSDQGQIVGIFPEINSDKWQSLLRP